MGGWVAEEGGTPLLFLPLWFLLFSRYNDLVATMEAGVTKLLDVLLLQQYFKPKEIHKILCCHRTFESFSLL